MKVCWVSNYYSPYKLKMFNELGKKVELTAVLLSGNDGNRNSEWSINNKDISFKIYDIDSSYNKLIKQLAEENDILINSTYSSIHGIKATSAFKKAHKLTIMDADGGIAKDRGFIVNKGMSYFMNRHDYFMCSGPITERYLNYYGVKHNKVSHYRFTSLMEKDIREHEELIDDKNKFRKELNIDDKFTFISVGQPIERKGFDILLKAYNKSNLKEKINLYIIGGDPQEEIKKYKEDNHLDNIHFIGLLNSKELNKYYAASDGFILCTREDIWGLVIEEAMSYGLPVITSDNCMAGVHFKEYNNSVILCRNENVDDYTNEIIRLFNDKDNYDRLSKLSLETIKEYTIENTAMDIFKILNKLVK